MHNRLIEKHPTHQGFTSDAIGEAVRVISSETGFVPDGEVHRRTIYDPDKTWRVRIRGTYNGQPADLRIDNLKLEVDEESIREAFRKRAEGHPVRPPHTYLHRPFDEKVGYGFAIEEAVDGPVLFDASIDAAVACFDFAMFYRQLREAIVSPFWPAPPGDAASFSKEQADTWHEIAETQDAERVARLAPLLDRLRERWFASVADKPLVFMHPHLSGSDVHLLTNGEYVVFANHFWSWRQPGYDVAFPLWGRWLAVPDDRISAEAIQSLTDDWMKVVGAWLSDLVSPADVRTMLLNRLYGSLLLDVPAQRHTRAPAAVAALEAALIAEAERLLA